VFVGAAAGCAGAGGGRGGRERLVFAVGRAGGQRFGGDDPVVVGGGGFEAGDLPGIDDINFLPQAGNAGCALAASVGRNHGVFPLGVDHDHGAGIGQKIRDDGRDALAGAGGGDGQQVAVSGVLQRHRVAAVSIEAQEKPGFADEVVLLQVFKVRPFGRAERRWFLLYRGLIVLRRIHDAQRQPGRDRPRDEAEHGGANRVGQKTSQDRQDESDPAQPGADLPSPVAEEGPE